MFDGIPQQTQETITKPPLILNVTKECIKRGIPQDSRKCMISLSLKNNGCRNPFVFFDGQFSFSYKGEEYGCKASSFLKDKIDLFDSFKFVTPFVLRIVPIKGYRPWEELEHSKKENNQDTKKGDNPVKQ